MEWSDNAIVLSSRPHGESGVILELLTRDHGRHLGLVRGGTSRRIRPTLQPGNSLDVQWRGRLAEHLGSYTAELAKARAGALMEGRDSLAGLNAFAAICAAALPERQPYPPVFVAGEILLDAMASSDAAHWLTLYARWEAGLLEALGFGLDLSECAATGETEDLAYVSPRSGRAVSRAGAGIYADRLFKLPPFLGGQRSDEGDDPGPVEIAAALRLTGHFLHERVLEPHGAAMPLARIRLDSLLSESR
ncbi:MAG: DNA repair protein RecO [Alphaproteobacteria bacterium]|nr:DNA repair protein RecO [Alphaproteobacteria bacterium]